MVKKTLLSNQALEKEITRQLNAINDEHITILLNKIKRAIRRSSVKQQEHLMHHFFTILRKIQRIKLTESVVHNICKIIEEKWHDWKVKEIKSLNLCLRAIEEAISDLALQELELESGEEEDEYEELKLESKAEKEEIEGLEESEDGRGSRRRRGRNRRRRI